MNNIKPKAIIFKIQFSFYQYLNNHNYFITWQNIFEATILCLFFASFLFDISIRKCEVLVYKTWKNIFYIRTCDCKASPGLGGVELAGSAGVHLDVDPVSLLRDVESRVQLVRSFVTLQSQYLLSKYLISKFDSTPHQSDEPDRTWCWQTSSVLSAPRILSCKLKCKNQL